MGCTAWAQRIDSTGKAQGDGNRGGFEKNMKDLEAIGEVVTSMKRSLAALGDCRKLLVSPTLYDAMRNLHAEMAMGAEDREKMRNGTLYFRGSPTIACDHLQGMEYAFVK